MDGIGTNRLEAFSDGVIAVIITIMVLELKVPRDTTLSSLRGVLPQFLSYLLSFLVVAIMWVNHHHMLHSARRADARLLWSNNTLLFWMSLVPFVTAFMGNHPRDPRAVALYGIVLTLCSLSFALLRSAIIQHHRDNPDVVQYHRGIQLKNLYSLFLYLASVPLAFLDVRISFFIFVFVALSHFLPERKLAENSQRGDSRPPLSRRAKLARMFVRRSSVPQARGRASPRGQPVAAVLRSLGTKLKREETERASPLLPADTKVWSIPSSNCFFSTPLV